MKLPFCKICGEEHRLGHCPLWDEPPKPKEKPHAENTKAAYRAVEEEGAAAVAQDPWREIYQATGPLTPEDMKQEEMLEPKQRFDRNAYQRELMRKRREQVR
jgi:hypothetical protein